MNLFQTTDHHLKDEEPFFQAGKDLDSWLIAFFHNQTEPFIYVDSGDRYHVSKETGRVNGEVVRFFLSVAERKMCKEIWILQGNHDYKVDTGSALSILEGLHEKIHVVKEPTIVQFPEQPRNSLLLPHMRIKQYPFFNGRESYGNEDFYFKFFQNWDTIKNSIDFIIAHLGDETCGDLLEDANLSKVFPHAKRSNGHIHKTVSSTQLESATITRRDETDKKCIMRQFDTKDFSSYKEISLPIFLNFAKLEYGTSLEEYFSNNSHKKPVTSLILDVYGHDNVDFVRKELEEKYKNQSNPKIYIGEIASKERFLSTESEEGEDLEVSSEDLVQLLKDFCSEKKVSESVTTDLIKRIGGTV